MKKFLRDLGSVIWRVCFWGMALATWSWTYLVLTGDMKATSAWVPLFSSVIWAALVGMQIEEWVNGKLIGIWKDVANNYKFLANTWEKNYHELVAMIEKRANELKNS